MFRKTYLEHLLARAEITVHPNGTTSYDRTVAWVSAGLAWDYPRYDRKHHYTAAVRYAKAHKHRLWTQPHFAPPWYWRHRQWAR
ncbi:MAG: thermonuclease family protein [Gammaproteobacteria bacterium]